MLTVGALHSRPSSQAALSAKNQELASEGHLRELAAREAGRLRADAEKGARARAEAEARAAALRAEVFATQERLDQFRLLMNWNQVRVV